MMWSSQQVNTSNQDRYVSEIFWLLQPSDPQFGPFLDLNRSAQHCGKQFWPIPEDLNKGAELVAFWDISRYHSLDWSANLGNKKCIEMWHKTCSGWPNDLATWPWFLPLAIRILGCKRRKGWGFPHVTPNDFQSHSLLFDCRIFGFYRLIHGKIYSLVRCVKLHNDSQRLTTPCTSMTRCTICDALLTAMTSKLGTGWDNAVVVPKREMILCAKRFWDRASRASCIKSSTQFSTTNNYQIISFESIIVVIQLLIAIVVLLYFIDGNHV